ncbi:Uncharacterized protein FKW44_021786 [Caligus rogercresseyi]|uniref:Uncharacterized protein n=1 Tax=Caligus rogercresseyi TaxID=217165 RepID=A0A7T8GRT4_CALRO|nr:Uncharacterized protein FKW44_021786 [Caligus rogercresseyi]
MTVQVVEICAEHLKTLVRIHKDIDGAILLHLNETHLGPFFGPIDEPISPNKASWIFGSSVIIIFGFLGFVYIMKDINLDDMDPEALEALKAQSENRHKKGRGS